MSFLQSCGQVRKLIAKADSPVSYSLPLGTNNIALAPLLEKQLHLRYTGKITCIHCKRSMNKSFNQGYCHSCFQKLAQCDVCIMSPERCHFEAGTCREPVWGEHFCMQDHIVYFANSSGLKVGITGHHNSPPAGLIKVLPKQWLPSEYVHGSRPVFVKCYLKNMLPIVLIGASCSAASKRL